jgi:hypothetical protein
METYEAPRLIVMGSFEELTLANNKIGFQPDAITPILSLVGSIVPARNP